MGVIRRIKKQTGRIAIVDTGLSVNGCGIFLGHPNPQKAAGTAKGFRGFLDTTVRRARCPNLSDMYKEHFKVLGKIESGEKI